MCLKCRLPEAREIFPQRDGTLSTVGDVHLRRTDGAQEQPIVVLEQFKAEPFRLP